MAVRTYQGLAGNAEALQMYLMADTVAGTREIDAVFFADRTDEPVVISVLKARLEGVVVDISYTLLSLYSGHAHSLIFEISHSARSVLSKGLVDAYTDLLSLDELAVNQMRFKDLFSQCKSHVNHFLPCFDAGRNAPVFYIIIHHLLYTKTTFLSSVRMLIQSIFGGFINTAVFYPN